MVGKTSSIANVRRWDISSNVPRTFPLSKEAKEAVNHLLLHYAYEKHLELIPIAVNMKWRF